MAANAIKNFTVINNILVGNTSFFGVAGPNCSTTTGPITPRAFVKVDSTVKDSTLQSQFVNVSNGDKLVCIEPPNGSYWPYNIDNPAGAAPSNPSDIGKKIGLGVGIPLGFLLVIASTFIIRRVAVIRAGMTIK